MIITKHFLGFFVLEKGFTLFGCDHLGPIGGSQQPFPCVLSHFRYGDEQTNKQPVDSSASLLLTSEKAVFCSMPMVRGCKRQKLQQRPQYRLHKGKLGAKWFSHAQTVHNLRIHTSHMLYW